MILEIIGSRILAPYLGVSLYTWTGLIGVILGSLSLGYYLGGKISNNNPSLITLSKLVLAAAVAVSLLTLLKDPLLSLVLIVTPDLRLASVLAGLLLFSPASIFLAMVSPYATRLAINSVGDSGEIAGKLSATATIGSIVGTFLAGFVLVSYLGLTQILAILAVSLLILALVLYRANTMGKSFLILTLLAGGLFISQPGGTGLIFQGETLYSFVKIFDVDKIRYLQINKEMHSAINLSSDEIVFPYLEAFLVLSHLHPHPQSALLIGGGGYTLPKYFLAQFPLSSLDIVEIDEQLPQLSQRYLGYRPSSKVKNYSEDGRIFLGRNHQKYDLIFLDAFSSFYSLPYQLTTHESIKLLKRGLKPDGMLLVNMVSGTKNNDSTMLQAYYQTLKQEFAYISLLPISNGQKNPAAVNVVIVAGNKPIDTDLVTSAHPTLFYQPVPKYYTSSSVPLLTDNYAPTDRYLSEMILSFKL